MKHIQELLDLIPDVCETISERAEFGYSEYGDHDWRFNNLIFQDNEEEWWIEFYYSATIMHDNEYISVQFDDAKIYHESDELTRFTEEETCQFLKELERTFNR